MMIPRAFWAERTTEANDSEKTGWDGEVKGEHESGMKELEAERERTFKKGKQQDDRLTMKVCHGAIR